MHREGFSPELVAPCGMNCAICAQHLALVNDVRNKGIRMPYCEGCRTRDKKCALLKKRCEALMNNRVGYCYECNDFPCKGLKTIDKRYQANFRTSLIGNLEAIKSHGITKFLEEQSERWRCSKCGGTVCCHNGVCFNCGMSELKNREKLFRWKGMQ